MNMDELRGRIDAVDDELLRCFAERMDIAGDIARYKAEHGLPVLDERREREMLYAVSEKAPEELQSYAVSLYALLFELSRSRQNRLLHKQSPLAESIQTAIEQTPPLFPEKAAVACQGVEGSNSQIACERLFRLPNELYFSSFDAVFNAIEKGLCRYGVLPIENSTAGSVNAVYDLMMRHHFHIVRSVRVKIDHNLLARPGAKLSGIREIYSHEQALSQCAPVPLVASGRESHPVREYGARGKARCGVRAGRRSGALHARVRTAVRSGMSRPLRAGYGEQLHALHLHCARSGDLSRRGSDEPYDDAAPRARLAL